MKPLTYCHIQYISVRDLKDVLVLYHEYASLFASDIHHNLTYNLREDSQDEGLSGFSRSPRLTHERRLPSVVETQGDESDNSVHLLPATRSLCNLLLTSFSNLVGLQGQSSTPQPLSLKEQSTPTATRVSAQGE